MNLTHRVDSAATSLLSLVHGDASTNIPANHTTIPAELTGVGAARPSVTKSTLAPTAVVSAPSPVGTPYAKDAATSVPNRTSPKTTALAKSPIAGPMHVSAHIGGVFR